MGCLSLRVFVVVQDMEDGFYVATLGTDTGIPRSGDVMSVPVVKMCELCCGTRTGYLPTDISQLDPALILEEETDLYSGSGLQKEQRGGQVGVPPSEALVSALAQRRSPPEGQKWLQDFGALRDKRTQAIMIMIPVPLGKVSRCTYPGTVPDAQKSRLGIPSVLDFYFGSSTCVATVGTAGNTVLRYPGNRLGWLSGRALFLLPWYPGYPGIPGYP
eukprot:3651761-Rhodomonas_salina.1